MGVVLEGSASIALPGEPHTFTEATVREMARHVVRPVIFPMSNPTSKSEAVPLDLLAYHYGQSANRAKQYAYYRQAGDMAAIEISRFVEHAGIGIDQGIVIG